MQNCLSSVTGAVCGYVHLKMKEDERREEDRKEKKNAEEYNNVASFHCFFLFLFDFQVDMPFPPSPSATARLSSAYPAWGHRAHQQQIIGEGAVKVHIHSKSCLCSFFSSSFSSFSSHFQLALNSVKRCCAHTGNYLHTCVSVCIDLVGVHVFVCESDLLNR